MKTTYLSFIISSISLLLTLSLSGCGRLLSSRMPNGSVSMRQAYNQAINGASDSTDSSSMDFMRKNVPPPHNVSSTVVLAGTTSETMDIQRLKNPNIPMYVYPHTVGTPDNLTPIPGYTTVFPLYRRVYYTLPNP